MSTGRVAYAAGFLHPRVSYALAAALLALAFALVPAAVRAEQPPDPADSAHFQRVESVIAAARAYIGTAYRVGTEGPATIDCSGLVFRAFSNAGELRQVGGARLRAAGYQRWFASRNLLTTDLEQAERGDLVMYANGKHIGIYLGDGRVISALVTGVTVHSLDGISQPVTGFLAVDWTGKRGPFTPVVQPSVDEPEAPAALVPAASWMPAAPEGDVLLGPLGERDERVDMRTANSRTFESTRGQFTTELFSRPIHYLPDGTHEWQPIDLRFRLPQQSEKFGAVADRGPVSLTLGGSRAGDALLTATAGETTLSLNTSGGAGDALAPEVSADSRFADYRDLLASGVGLRVLPRADGFKAFLVFGAEPGKRTFDFDLDSAGLMPTAEIDGSVTLRDAGGTVVGRFTKPMLLDSSDVDGDAAGVRADAVAFSLASADDGSSRLSLTIEEAALAEAVYPAYVDIALVDFPNTSFSAAHAFVSSYHPNGNFSTFQRPESGYAELWHGRRPGRGDDNEAYLQFPNMAALLRGTNVESASLELFPYWQGGGEGASPTRLGRVAAPWDVRGVTWNTRPAAVLDATTYETTQGTWSGIDVGAYVRDVVGGAADYGLVLHANGAGRDHWKRFIAESSLDSGALEPRLVVTWSGMRPSATAAAIANDAVALEWTNIDLAPAATRVQVQVSGDSFASVAQQFRARGNAAAAGTASIPTSGLNPGSYSWRVRAKYGDATQWSDWSDAGTFSVGVPAAPTLVVRRGETIAF